MGKVQLILWKYNTRNLKTPLNRIYYGIVTTQPSSLIHNCFFLKKL